MTKQTGLLPPYTSRWALVEGYYLFCSLWHGGQSSDLYAKLCRIGNYFTPGPCWSESKILDQDNDEYFETRAVYEALCAKHGFEPYDN